MEEESPQFGFLAWRQAGWPERAGLALVSCDHRRGCEPTRLSQIFGSWKSTSCNSFPDYTEFVFAPTWGSLRSKKYLLQSKRIASKPQG